MKQKTISLSERVYKLLKKEKKESESFSDVIERFISKKENPWIKMQNKFDPELFNGLKERIRNMREEDLTGREDG